MGKHMSVQAAKKPKGSSTRPGSSPGDKIMTWFHVCEGCTLCTLHLNAMLASIRRMRTWSC